MIRTPEAIMALVRAIDVEHQFCFQRHAIDLDGDGPGETAVFTVCNCYVCVIAAAMGCPLPAGYVVNQLESWLSDADLGGKAGWHGCSAAEALFTAERGVPLLVVLTERPHGHIAWGVPSPKGDSGELYVSAAGRRCFVRTPAVNSFGFEKMKAAVYFWHA